MLLFNFLFLPDFTQLLTTKEYANVCQVSTDESDCQAKNDNVVSGTQR